MAVRKLFIIESVFGPENMASGNIYGITRERRRVARSMKIYIYIYNMYMLNCNAHSSFMDNTLYDMYMSRKRVALGSGEGEKEGCGTTCGLG